MREKPAWLVLVAMSCGVDEEHVAGLRADAADVAVGQLGLDDVAHDAVPAGEDKVALEGGRADVEGGLDIDAVERIVADGGNAVAQVGEVGNLADGVGGEAQCAFGNDAPSAGVEGKREMRIEVDAADVAGVEAGLRAAEVAERGAQSPVEGRVGRAAWSSTS